MDPMTTPALRHAVPYREWSMAVEGSGRAEVVDGRLVVEEGPERPVATDNRHDVVAHRLARALEDAWGVTACAPAAWLIQGDAGGVAQARIPDAMVGGDGLLEPGPFVGEPLLVVEVWSATNTFGEILAKRRTYLQAGAGAMVEAAVDEGGTVSLTWFVRAAGPSRWELHAFAVGAEPLVASLPRPFTVVPDALLARRA